MTGKGVTGTDSGERGDGTFFKRRARDLGSGFSHISGPRPQSIWPETKSLRQRLTDMFELVL